MTTPEQSPRRVLEEVKAALYTAAYNKGDRIAQKLCRLAIPKLDALLEGAREGRCHVADLDEEETVLVLRAPAPGGEARKP